MLREKGAGALKSNAFSVQPTAVNYNRVSSGGAKRNYSFHACGIYTFAHLRSVSPRRQRKMIVRVVTRKTTRGSANSEGNRPVPP